jgi:DNA gyrase subunit A
VIKGELREVRARYADPRRTEIVADEGEISIEDLIARARRGGHLLAPGLHQADGPLGLPGAARGGRGKIGMEARDEDFINKFFIASTHDHVLFLSDHGKVYLKKVYEIPEGSRTSKGRSIVNFVGRRDGAPRREGRRGGAREAFKDGMDLVTATARGLVKRTELKAYANIRATGIIAVAIEEGDALLRATVTESPTRRSCSAPAKGMSIRFKVSEIRQVGRDSRGVRGIELRDGDTGGLDGRHPRRRQAGGALGVRQRLRQAHARSRSTASRAAAASASSRSRPASATATSSTSTSSPTTTRSW